MAYIVNPDVKQSNPDDVAQLTGPKLLTGAPGSDGGTNPLTSSPSNAAYTPSSNSPTSSGSFTNLQQYLDTNQPQATQLGQQLGGQIAQKSNDATSAINDASNNFRQQVDQNTVKLDPTLQNKAISDPANFVNSADFDKFSKILGGTYTGPTSLASTDLYAPTAQKVADATVSGQLADTSGGRMELLRERSASSPYSNGGVSLDQMLVQNTDPARQAVEQGASTTRPLADNFTKAQGDLANTAANAVTASQQAAQDAKTGLINAQQSFRDQLTARVTAQQQEAAARQQAIQDALAAASAGIGAGSPAFNTVGAVGTALQVAGQADPSLGAWGSLGNTLSGVVPRSTMQSAQPQGPTAEQLASMGITAEQFANLQALNAQAKSLGGAGVNFQDYFHAADPSQIGLSNVATADDAARYAALSRMAGTADTFMPGAVGAAVKAASFDPATASIALQGQIDAANARAAAEAQNQAAIAANKAAADQVTSATKKATTKSAVMSGAATGASIGASVSDGIGAVVGGVIGAIGGAIFCFVKGTPILMQDGSVKNVEEIEIGDEMLLGGTVYAAGKAVETDVYKYHNTYMGASHTVFCEDGVWRKVANAEGAEKVELDGGVIVCPIVNHNHLIVTSDFISADFAEVDNAGWDMNGKQRLDYLNAWTERNEQLRNVLKSVFPDKYVDEDTTISEE